MKLENEFTVNAPIERAWAVLTDIPEIAPCLPGAKLTGNDGDSYQGKVKIKVGPITAEYAGTADFIEKNEETRHVVINAKGRDARGSGNASAVITADMTPDGSGTRVTIDTDLKIAGKVAQFGKGVIGDVSKKLIDQFVDCIEAKLQHEGGDADAPAEVAAASAAMQQPAAAAQDAATAGASASADGVTDAAGGVADTAKDAADTAKDAADATSNVAENVTGRVTDAAAGASGGASKAAAAAVAGGGAAGAVAAKAAGSVTGGFGSDDDEEMEALDLMDAAGGAVAKRLIPVLAVVAIIAVVLWIVL